MFFHILPGHFCYDRYSLSSRYYERHSFYRKQLWCFSTFRTKNIHKYLVCCCQRTFATIDISFRVHITSGMRFIENISGVFPRLKRIYTYLVCCCQRAIAMIDIPFRVSITNRTRFIENISGVFPHLERRIYTSCLLLPAHFYYDRY